MTANNPHDVTNKLFAIATTFALFMAGGLTVPASAFPDDIVLTGFARDFLSSHEDFAVAPPVPDGNGHYAGNVSQILGADGAPLQVHGVTGFNIDFGSLVHGMPYAARLSSSAMCFRASAVVILCISSSWVPSLDGVGRP